MTYAFVVDGAIVSVGRLPVSARRLDNGNWVLGLASAPTELVEACGWFPIVDTPRPADTASTTFDRSVQLVGGVPTVVWVERPKSAGELQAETESANSATLRTQAEAALDANRTYLALSTPSQAQAIAQVNALTRQVNKLIRLAIGRFDGTD